MMRKMVRAIVQCLLVAALGTATRASADVLAHPNTGFELGASLGYAQGFGPTGKGAPRLKELGNAGGAVQIDAGWRLDPHWLVGAYGELALFGEGNMPDSDHALSLAAGLQGQYHLMPDARVDPWISLGVGWRGYWANFDYDRTYKLQGMDLARLRVGLDYRVSSKLAIGPVAGVTLTKFFSENPVGADGYRDISDKKLNTFVFAGIGGRFGL